MVTSDQAFGKVFSDMCNELHIRHHLSAVHHPEGHGSVERANREVQRVLRALVARRRRWTDFVKPVEFVLNTSYSRTLGTSPFEVIHGFRPRLPIRAVLQLPTEFLPSSTAGEEDDSETSRLWNGDDPIEFSQNLLSISSLLFSKVRDIQKKLYDEELRAALRARRGKSTFEDNEYVLVAFPQTSSLEYRWMGPYQIVGKEYPTMYKVKSLVEGNDEVSRVPASRLFAYNVGNLSVTEIKNLAAFPKLICEKVLEHRESNGVLYFFAKWGGVPLQDSRDSDSWLSWAECRFCPPIRKYCQDHGIRPRLHLNQAENA